MAEEAAKQDPTAAPATAHATEEKVSAPGLVKMKESKPIETPILNTKMEEPTPLAPKSEVKKTEDVREADVPDPEIAVPHPDIAVPEPVETDLADVPDPDEDDLDDLDGMP